MSHTIAWLLGSSPENDVAQHLSVVKCSPVDEEMDLLRETHERLENVRQQIAQLDRRTLSRRK